MSNHPYTDLFSTFVYAMAHASRWSMCSKRRCYPTRRVRSVPASARTVAQNGKDWLPKRMACLLAGWDRAQYRATGQNGRGSVGNDRGLVATSVNWQYGPGLCSGRGGSGPQAFRRSQYPLQSGNAGQTTTCAPDSAASPKNSWKRGSR